MIDRAEPDNIIEQGPLRAAMYELDLSAVTLVTAPLVVSHTFGRIGAAYQRWPDHAHNLNVYLGDGVADEIRDALFPELDGAAHSISACGRPAKPFQRRHGVLRPMTPSQAESFLAIVPMSFDIFEIGPSDRPVEMYGVSVRMTDVAAFERCVVSPVALTWLTPVS
jgi:hypothetical protein